MEINTGKLKVIEPSGEVKDGGVAFIGLPHPARIINSSISWCEETKGRFAAALFLSANEMSYFVSPSTTDALLNGQDGVKTVEESIVVFANAERALTEAWEFLAYPESHALVVFRFEMDVNDLCLAPALVVYVDTEPELGVIGPTYCDDEWIEFDVHSWIDHKVAERNASITLNEA